MISPVYPTEDKVTKSYLKSLIVPYWLVKETEDESLANMKQSTLQVKVSIDFGKEYGTEEKNVGVPILTNSRSVKPGDELLCFNPSLAKARVTIELAPTSDGKRKTAGGQAAGKRKKG